MTIETFDDFTSTEADGGSIDLKPFPFREDTSHEGTLDWLSEYFEAQVRMSQSRHITYRNFMNLFKGIQHRGSDTRDNNRYAEDFSRRKPKMVINFIYEMLDQKVSKASRMKAGIAAIPNNDEQNDVNNARACKLLLDNRSAEIDLDGLFQERDRLKYLMGMGFHWIRWNAELGPKHPSYEALEQKYEGKLPSSIKKRLNKDSMFVGDVDVEAIGPERVFPEIGRNKWEDVRHVGITEWVLTDELKHDYPKKEILDEDVNYLNLDLTEYDMRRNFTLVHHFYYPADKYMEKGVYIKWCGSAILEWRDYPYEHNKLPLTFDKDIVIYDELWGRSFISNIEQMQKMYNAIMSAQARDLIVASAPKWMMPKGAAKISALNNEATVVEWTGGMEPKLVKSNPISGDSMAIQDRLEDKISKQSAIYDISRGQVPAGVTANSALRFLDEQESQRDSSATSRRRTAMLETYRMMMSLMGQYYNKSDGRTIRILGEKNEYMIESLQDADFSRVYDIRIQNTTALPDTKTGKISAIIDLNAATQMDPIFRKEELVELLDLGMDESFKTGASVAVDSARSIIDRLLRGQEVPEPKEYDNLLVWYDMFKKAIQSPNFRLKVDPETTATVLEYVQTLEYVMFMKASKNVAFINELMTDNQYPMLFTLPQSLFMIAQQMQAPLDPQAGMEAGAMDSSQIKTAPKVTEKAIKES